MADKLLEYTDLLHSYDDPDIHEVRVFSQRYADDPVFRSRVEKLNALNLLRAAVQSGGTAALAAEEPPPRIPALAPEPAMA